MYNVGLSLHKNSYS